ncbi:MAG: FkbM family methyltransferase [Luteitalea sp.]|nr:FkbM family methyltransferase [Luteitalea sp.]
MIRGRQLQRALSSRSGVTPVIRQPGRAVTYAARRTFRPAIICHFGVRLAVDRDLLSPAIVDSLYRGGYEAAEVDIIRSTVTPDDRVLEVGGGIGFTGIIAAHIVQRPDDVLIVEPNPQLIPLMERNFRLNGVCPTVRNAVLGQDGRTEVPFFIHRDFWASSLTAFKGARETTVPQLDVRTIVKAFRPTYLIVDIEGGEVDLFDKLALDGVEKICLEVHPGRTGRAAVDDLFAGLARQQFAQERASRLENVVFFRRRSA